MKEEQSVSLVRATIDDAAQILALKQRAFAEEFAMYGVKPPHFDQIEKTRRAIEEKLYYKVMLGDRLVGGICLVDEGDDGWYVGSVYVDECLQGRGIGQTAMATLFREHPEPRRWYLDTPCRSYRNHHFYEKLGFVKVGEFTPEYAPSADFRLFVYERPVSCITGS